MSSPAIRYRYGPAEAPAIVGAPSPHTVEADAASPAFRAGPAEVIRLGADPLA